MSFGVEQVSQAIDALYSGSDQTARNTAQTYLNEFQSTVHAWSVCDALLHRRTQGTSQQACYFAAQTMRTKVLYSFHELPQESYDSLRNSLVQHLQTTDRETDRAMVTQLALALVDFALQAASWEAPLQDMQAAFSQNHTHVFLMLLRFLPEEGQSSKLRLGANRRHQVQHQLAGNMSTVLRFLEQYVVASTGGQTLSGSTHSQILCNVYECLQSWLSLRSVVPLQPETPALNNNVTDPLPTPLLRQAFDLLAATDTNTTLHEILAECISSALCLIVPVQNPLYTEAMYGLVHGLSTPFHTFVGLEDCDKVINVGRVFIELAESLVDAFVRVPNQGPGNFATIELVLSAISFHDYALVQMSFNLWYRISEAIYQIDNEQLNQLFHPIIQRLLLVLFKHAQLDSDFESIPDAADVNDFRTRLTECVRDVAFIPGSTTIFSQMFEHLRSLGAKATWDETESALYIMAAVAKNILPSEETIVPSIVQAIFSLDASTHVAVRYTALELLSQLDDWFNENRQWVGQVVQFCVLCATTDRRLGHPAAKALDSLAHRSGSLMTDHLQDLSSVLLNVGLPEKAIQMQCSVVSRVIAYLPSDQLTQRLRELCSLQFEPLKQLIQNDTGVVECTANGDENAPPAKSQNSPITYVDRLAAIFRACDPSNINGNVHPCLPIVEELFPIWSAAADRFCSDGRVMERLCRCIRYAVRCVGAQIHSLMEPLVTQLMSLYEKNQHSCLLYLGSVLVDEYATNQLFISGLLHMTESFINTAQLVFQRCTSLRDCPDTIDDLFRLVLRLVQRNARATFTWPHFASVYSLAIGCLSVEHREANESVSKFIAESIEDAESMHRHVHKRNKREADLMAAETAICRIVHDSGPQLLVTLLNAVAFVLTRTVISMTAEIVYSLSKYDSTSLDSWLSEALKALPRQAPGGTLTATDEQLEAFRSSILQAKDLAAVQTAMLEFARLFK